MLILMLMLMFYFEFDIKIQYNIAENIYIVQWKPLNVITDNVIIWLMLSN